MYKWFFAFIAFLSLTFNCFGSANLDVDTGRLVVSTKQGLLEGIKENGVSVWKGIPYAKAPIGDLRFKAPQPAENWTGVKKADKFGNIAMGYKRSKKDQQEQSEDCLFLNIWSPAADAKKRPVMFWIHGGGFISGSGSSDLYDGAHLANKGDVVVVTINYRMGPFGFLYFDGLPNHEGFENNLGIKDQVAALKWVHDNIASFGGDPNNVTIFGESAGAISVQTLMAVPSAKGLFQKAIAESGAPKNIWGPEFSSAFTKRYLQLVGVDTAHLEKLKTINADTMAVAMRKLLDMICIEATPNKTIAPTLDGSFLPQNLMEAIQSGSAANVPLLIGTNKDEATLFALKSLNMAPRTAKGLIPYVSRFSPEQQKNLLSAYKNYPHKSGVLSIITDGVFAMPSMQFAALQSEKAPTYMYRFDWSSTPLNIAGLRACHGVELPFVFGNFNTRVGKLVLLMAKKKDIYKIADEMQQAWINFARTGNPNSSNAVNWMVYNVNQRSTLIFNRKQSTVNDPDASRREAWGALNIFE